MISRKKLWMGIWISAFIIFGSLIFGYYQYTKANTDSADKKPDVTISARTLFTEFSRDEQEANEKYFNKLTCTKGIVKSIDKDKRDMVSLALMAGDSVSEIFCQLDPRHFADIEKLSPGDTIEVQGICAGMLTDVLLVGCSAKQHTSIVKL